MPRRLTKKTTYVRLPEKRIQEIKALVTHGNNPQCAWANFKHKA